MDASKKETIGSTRQGDIRIRGFCTPQEIRTYRFDSQFGTYAHYKSLYTRKKSLEESADRKDANVVLALENKKDIIGFGVLAYPDPGERWSSLGPEKMMEIKALEVCRRWRGTTVAKGILKMLLSHSEIEEKIDRVAVMKNGSLKAVGRLEELCEGMNIPLRLYLTIHGKDEFLEGLLMKEGAVDIGYKNGYLLASIPRENKLELISAIMEEKDRFSDLSIREPSLEEVFVGLH